MVVENLKSKANSQTIVDCEYRTEFVSRRSRGTSTKPVGAFGAASLMISSIFYIPVMKDMMVNFLPVQLLLTAILPLVASLAAPASSPVQYYFAYGSNMDPATMESLRRLRPHSAQAAVLNGYKLIFDIAGVPFIEPSAASVRKQVGSVVHGVLWELSEDDFARVGQTEGVPSVYQWESCEVIPYAGDGRRAGEAAVDAGIVSVQSYTLVKSSSARLTRGTEHIPPSRSYLAILQKAAAYWKMDRSYQISLSKVRVADNLVIRDGLSGALLTAAKLVNPIVDAAS